MMDPDQTPGDHRPNKALWVALALMASGLVPSSEISLELSSQGWGVVGIDTFAYLRDVLARHRVGTFTDG